jgi:predicted transcriptional regulator
LLLTESVLEEFNALGQKFYRNSLTIIVKILRILQTEEDGLVQSRIRETLRLSKQLVSYYLGKLADNKLVEGTGAGPFRIWKLTQPGKIFLGRYNKRYCNGNQYECRAENIRFRAQIIRMPAVPVDWQKIQLHNWVQYVSEIDTITVKINNTRTPTLELIPSPIDGDDPYDLFVSLVYECINVIQQLEERIGIKVGTLHLSKGTEWVVYDPIARILTKNHKQVNYDGIAIANASGPKRIGEFEFHDPRAAREYLLMPQRLQRMEVKLSRVLDLLVKLELSCMSENQAMVSNIKIDNHPGHRGVAGL